MKFLNARYVFVALRVVAGLIFACHGAQKLFGAFGGQPATSVLPVVAGPIEFFGGLMIACGLWAGIAAFIASGEMAVAYFLVHFPMGPIPIENKGELAVVYCFLFLYIASVCSGAFSLERAIWHRSERVPVHHEGSAA
jgi:putative oxidoreductase